MQILGIETSCDDTGIAIIRDGIDVVTNLVSSQIEIHKPYGGVVPEIAARAHVKCLLPLLDQALKNASLTLHDLNAIAVTYGPGLAGCLLSGISFAKSIAFALQKPLIGIHHLQAHVYTTVLNRETSQHPPFPHLSLLVSGGHTALYRVEDWNQLTLIGKTKDDAAGEAFDKVAKVLDLGFPGGPAIQKRADNYSGDLIPFPRPMLYNGLDFSFSGLKTAVVNYIRDHAPDEYEITQISASFQEAVIDVLVSKTIRAAEEGGFKHISLVGGVSANQPLRNELGKRAQEKGITLYLPDKQFSMDNGAMVAGLAYHAFKRGHIDDLSLNAHP